MIFCIVKKYIFKNNITPSKKYLFKYLSYQCVVFTVYNLLLHKNPNNEIPKEISLKKKNTI